MLDLSCEEAFQEWNPERNFLVSVLFFLKKIFYMKSFSKYERVPNPEARELYAHLRITAVVVMICRFANSKEEYYNRVQECVRQSLVGILSILQSNYVHQSTIHENPPNCTILFTEVSCGIM